MADGDALASLKGVTKVFISSAGPRQVLNDITLHLRAGECLAIVGPNGSGKTTLLKLLLGLIRPDHGSVTIASNQTISYIPQDYRNALFPWLRIHRNIQLHARGKSKTADVLEIASRIGLKIDTNKFPYQLSGGEQQALVLLQALIAHPDWVIADEPFSAIDFHKKARMLDYFLRHIKSSGAAACVVVHDVSDAFWLADRVLVLGSTGIREEFLIAAKHPRDAKWRQTDEFTAMVRRATEAFE